MRLDHFLTFTSASTIEAQLARYQALGFETQSRTVRHEPGLRNGFVQLGPEYLEFLWVEDESLFAAAPSEDRELRTLPRPFAIGIATADVTAVRDAWAERGCALPEAFSKGARDAKAGAPPVWTFLEVPRSLLPGADTFLVQYRTRRAMRTYVYREVRARAVDGGLRREQVAPARCPGLRLGRDQCETGDPIDRVGGGTHLRRRFRPPRAAQPPMHCGTEPGNDPA